jgi:CubicO group peptidase (beta-lactamase class C family)
MLSKDSVYPVASVTKFLTALAIGQLIDQKRVSLDAEVDTLIDLPTQHKDKQIKIRHLLSHTSGLPDYLDESSSEVVSIDNKKLLKVSDYLLYFPDKPMESKPGTIFKYHNGAFVYLALIIEKLSQMTYQEYINKYLLAPLGINNSGIYNVSELREHKAMGYLDINQSINHIGYIPEVSGGDGGAYFNAHDFHKLVIAFLNYEILSKQLTDAFLHPQIVVEEDKNVYYGLGLCLIKKDDKYVPHVIGVDAGMICKCHFFNQGHSFYWISSNSGQDIWELISIFDQVH